MSTDMKTPDNDHETDDAQGDALVAGLNGHTQRRQFLTSLTALGIGTTAFQRAIAAQVEESNRITPEMISSAEWIAGIELDDDERQSVASSIRQILASGQRLRALPVDADTVPALVYRPDFFYGQAPSHVTGDKQTRVSWSLATPNPQRIPPEPDTDEVLAFASINTQATLLSRKQISSRELTELYLARLKKYDPLLNCVITLLEEHALQQAEAADRRRSQNRSLGILDGIPWVAKDLIALPPWKTTWGAEPFKDQVRNTTATVAERMQKAGAVLLAKVTLGALAWGDRWFGGMTRNPWNPRQGSSGSSAGSASAVAAGLASFALGSETLGSIVSPTRRCRTSGLRPTFGRVSRAGCMPLAWSMDKIGPIARHVDDLAFVFANLTGPDGRDPTLVERGFRWPLDARLDDWKIGVTGDRLTATEQQALSYFESEGASIVELDLTSELPVDAMNFVLGTEASTVFDDAFRENQAADYGRWPGTFRQSQFVPAIQYLRANRQRSDVIVETEEKLLSVDVVLGGNDLLLTNLTGHPSVVVSCGTEESQGINMPGVAKLTAAAYREERLLHAALLLQRTLPPRPVQPQLDKWLEEQTNE